MNRVQWGAAGVFAALALAFGVGLWAGNTGDHAAAANTIQIAPGSGSITLGGSTATPPSNVDVGRLWLAWQLLDQNFVETHASSSIPTNDQKLYGAIAGLTASYGDPYTVFFPPQQAQEFNEDIQGSFGGVGMELGEKGNDIVVIAPLKDSPAEAAGVRSGDVLIAIGATSTDGMTVDQAVGLIRGPVGTKVTVTFARLGVSRPIVITITRQTINIPIIDSYKRGDGTFVISLYSFSQNSPDLFRSALRDFFNSGSTNLILDLRSNPGGYLEAAVDMASYFLPVGDSIVTEDFRGRADNITHRSYGYNVFANKKLSMAILVDQGTASAAEILSGALSQHGVAKLIGTRTFGKGSVQQLMDLGGGAELKITVARWLTPNGTSISDGGLQPDIKVDRTQDDVTAGKDPQMDAAVSWLATQ